MNHERKQADSWIEFTQLCAAINEPPVLIVTEEVLESSDEAKFINAQAQHELEISTQEIRAMALARRVPRHENVSKTSPCNKSYNHL